MNRITPVILSGGSGARLWPLSCEAHPKQFLPILGQRSLLQAAALRLNGLDAYTLLEIVIKKHDVRNYATAKFSKCSKVGTTAKMISSDSRLYSSDHLTLAYD